MSVPEARRLTRIAIVDPDRCKPNRCRLECKGSCPVNRQGQKCIEVGRESKVARIAESLCIGCGICPRKCPFGAIQIINLPTNLAQETTHRYGPNGFKLHRLPTPRPGQVLGLVGSNGIGKSTALKILAGKLKPNLGRVGDGDSDAPSWPEIVAHFRGGELQNFFGKLARDEIRAVIKPQFVDHIPRAVRGKVGQLLDSRDERKRASEIRARLSLDDVWDRPIDALSGGELQRFAIAVVCVRQANVYLIDEPSSFLDIRQRLQAARVLRDLCADEEDDGTTTTTTTTTASEARVGRYVIVVEHDLSVLDYLSDFVCCLYGKPGAYGVVTLPFSVREGINVFLAGFVPTENLRFRDEALSFKVASDASSAIAEGKESNGARGDGGVRTRYPALRKRLGDFSLRVEAGSFSTSEIVVLLGENGTGKTTWIRLLAGVLAPDADDEDGKNPDRTNVPLPRLNVSYKPQKIAPKFQGTVRQLLASKIATSLAHSQWVADVMRPLNLDGVLDRLVGDLSGGELQRVAIALALGKPADVYLIDEPSAYLDAEQRHVVARILKRFVLHAQKTAFVVEHDFMLATYLADRVIVYEGTPARDCFAHAPDTLVAGMNRFLRSLDVTFRRDAASHRPRINKANSVKDRSQKRAGTFFYIGDGDGEGDDAEEDVSDASRASRTRARQ